MYESYFQYPKQVDAACERLIGRSFAQFCYDKLESEQTRFSRIYFRLRRKILGLPGGEALIRYLRPQFVS